MAILSSFPTGIPQVRPRRPPEPRGNMLIINRVVFSIEETGMGSEVGRLPLLACESQFDLGAMPRPGTRANVTTSLSRTFLPWGLHTRDGQPPPAPFGQAPAGIAVVSRGRRMSRWSAATDEANLRCHPWVSGPMVFAVERRDPNELLDCCLRHALYFRAVIVTPYSQDYACLSWGHY